MASRLSDKQFALRYLEVFEEASARFDGDIEQVAIPADMEFVDWCEHISKDRIDPTTGKTLKALRIDNKRFDLTDRPAMRAIYAALPSTLEAAKEMQITIMKCAQVGFTVMEMLYVIFLALKFEPMAIGMFVPQQALARTKSSHRLMPIARTIPEAHQSMIVDPGTGRRRGEGSVELREFGQSKVHILWTSGATTTESNPMDAVSFDEVQEMLIADMEKTKERLSASTVKLTLMGSTANWPEADIDYWYQQGSRRRFHTQCPTCGREEPLDEYFPDCIEFDPTHPNRFTGGPGEYRYRCRDGHWIDDPQVGEWRPENPEAEERRHVSFHFHQMLSPTISPREIIEAWLNADDRKNFYNRKLGKPYQDPSQIPVTLEHLNKCAEDGMKRGLGWKTEATGTYMGVDQMGAYNVVVIKERLADGHQAVIHVEEVNDPDPFAKCDALMERYGVQVCVVEEMPNYNDAHRFADRWPRRVILGHYGQLEDEILRWNDAPKLSASQRRTTEEARTRFTVTMNQYKCMDRSLKRFVKGTCLFPDPQALTQVVVDKGVRRTAAVLKDRMFPHLMKTALVTERINEGERRFRHKVVKVGVDPHFAFANLLCDVAWARAHGTTSIILEDVTSPGAQLQALAEQMNLQGAPQAVLEALAPLPRGEICGNCTECPMTAEGPPASFFCNERGVNTDAASLGCPLFVTR
jgi:hypothetical protein